MKNYQYVLDIETPFIRKLYDKEDNYKVELLTPYGILEEIKKLQEENADLEQKLAESDENIKLLEQDRVVICNTMDMYREKVEKLKQQLAEKEKEIKMLKLDLGMFKSVNEFLNGYGIEKAREVLLQTEKTKHQDKIEFAIAKLEKVKEFALKDFDLDKSNLSLARVLDKIDQQINELKEMK